MFVISVEKAIILSKIFTFIISDLSILNKISDFKG